MTNIKNCYKQRETVQATLFKVSYKIYQYTWSVNCSYSPFPVNEEWKFIQKINFERHIIVLLTIPSYPIKILAVYVTTSCDIHTCQDTLLILFRTRQLQYMMIKPLSYKTLRAKEEVLQLKIVSLFNNTFHIFC